MERRGKDSTPTHTVDSSLPFDPLEYWNTLGAGWNLKILRLRDGGRAYQYSHQIYPRSNSGYRYEYNTFGEDGKRIAEDSF